MLLQRHGKYVFSWSNIAFSFGLHNFETPPGLLAIIVRPHENDSNIIVVLHIHFLLHTTTSSQVINTAAVNGDDSCSFYCSAIWSLK